MRILQLIDSLRPGGAERMAVSYANALAERGVQSFICASRMEGALKEELSAGVGYLFLGRTSTLDVRAIRKLRSFVRYHDIDIIHAHSTSFFLALAVKAGVPGLKLVWHDHRGRSMTRKSKTLMRLSCRFSDRVFSVNSDLVQWTRGACALQNAVYINNFRPAPQNRGKAELLRGGDGFKIICVANFREEKDHQNLLRAFKLLAERHQDLSLHLVGRDELGAVGQWISGFVEEKGLERKVFLYGERGAVDSLLQQADLGVLSSSSEGLPLVLLEYGMAGLPVVCTEVGQCGEVVGECGSLVKARDHAALAAGIAFYLQNEEQRETDAAGFQQRVLRLYSQEVVMEEVLGYYRGLMLSSEVSAVSDLPE